MKEDIKKLVYGLLRCPSEVMDILVASADLYKWEHGGKL